MEEIGVAKGNQGNKENEFIVPDKRYLMIQKEEKKKKKRKFKKIGKAKSLDKGKSRR